MNLYLGIGISQTKNSFKNIFIWEKQINKNKFVEIEYGKHPCSLEVAFRVNTKSDHAGFEFKLAVFKREFVFYFYDRRHWNKVTKNYEEF